MSYYQDPSQTLTAEERCSRDDADSARADADNDWKALGDDDFISLVTLTPRERLEKRQSILRGDTEAFCRLGKAIPVAWQDEYRRNAMALQEILK